MAHLTLLSHFYMTTNIDVKMIYIIHLRKEQIVIYVNPTDLGLGKKTLNKSLYILLITSNLPGFSYQ